MISTKFEANETHRSPLLPLFATSAPTLSKSPLHAIIFLRRINAGNPKRARWARLAVSGTQPVRTQNLLHNAHEYRQPSDNSNYSVHENDKYFLFVLTGSRLSSASASVCVVGLLVFFALSSKRYDCFAPARLVIGFVNNICALTKIKATK